MEPAPAPAPAPAVGTPSLRNVRSTSKAAASGVPITAWHMSQADTHTATQSDGCMQVTGMRPYCLSGGATRARLYSDCTMPAGKAVRSRCSKSTYGTASGMWAGPTKRRSLHAVELNSPDVGTAVGHLHGALSRPDSVMRRRAPASWQTLPIVANRAS